MLGADIACARPSGARLSHDRCRSSRTAEIASFGPIGSKSSVRVIRHTAVRSCSVGSAVSTVDGGRSFCAAVSGRELRFNVIACASTDSVRRKGNSRLKEVGMPGETLVTDTSVESEMHGAIAELIRAMHTDACGDAGARWSLVTAAALHLPAVCHASIMAVGQPGVVKCLAASDEVPRFLDEVQQRLREGPGLDAACERQVCRIGDLDGELRWSRFVEVALANTPIRSILALPLFTRGFPRSVLNLYGDRPDVFGAEHEHIGLAFVADAGTAVETWRREQRFRRALINRDTIGQAKGILMERFDIDAVAAFSLMAESSKNQGQSVSSIARALVRRKLVNHGGKRFQS